MEFRTNSCHRLYIRRVGNSHNRATFRKVQERRHRKTEAMEQRKFYPFPWIHLSSSNFTSVISGKTLQNSSFSLQGLFNDSFSLVFELEGSEIAFESHKGKRSYECHWELNEINDNESQKLHWILSVHNRRYVIDVDVYSMASQMFVRSLELAEGGRNTLKILTDGEGVGEIRFYKRIRRNLELIECAKLAGTFCEFGQKEEADL